MSTIIANNLPNPGSTETDTLNGRRRRRWAPKVRTGCLTCKTRRIKCDETKPSCEKCTSTGRKCDGYEDNALEAQPVARSRASNAATKQPKTSRARALVPVSAAAAAAAATAQPYSVSWLPFYGGELQKRSFDFFQSVTSSALSSFYGSEFWTQETLQVAHQYPALFHAITAFGSIHHSYLSDETPSDVPRIGTNSHIEFGLSEFNKAIKSMSALMTQKELSMQDQQAILTTCVLFTGLSSLQGRQSQAFMHVKNGLRMIHHWRLNNRMITPEEKNAVDTLLLTFVRLDTQIRPYLVGQESLLQWTDEDIVGALSPQRAFQTIFEAYFDLEVLFNKLLRLNFDVYSFKQLALEIELLRNQGEIWDRQFAHLLSTITLTASELDALDFIRLRREYARAVLSCLVINVEDNVHDDLIPIYQAIMDLSENVLQKDSYTLRHGVPDSQKLEHPIFVLGSTIIEPLFFTATRCREPILRRCALYLLRLCPRREGICEGMMACKIVQKVIEVEEQECPRFIDWYNRNPSSATTLPSPPTAPSPQFLPIRTSPHAQKNNFRATSESMNVIMNHLDIPTSPLNYPTSPETRVAKIATTMSGTKTATTTARKSECSEKGKWVCEKHRVVETQYLLFTERQIKIVIWTGEDFKASRQATVAMQTGTFQQDYTPSESNTESWWSKIHEDELPSIQRLRRKIKAVFKYHLLFPPEGAYWAVEPIKEVTVQWARSLDYHLKLYMSPSKVTDSMSAKQSGSTSELVDMLNDLNRAIERSPDCVVQAFFEAADRARLDLVFERLRCVSRPVRCVKEIEDLEDMRMEWEKGRGQKNAVSRLSDEYIQY